MIKSLVEQADIPKTFTIRAPLTFPTLFISWDTVQTYIHFANQSGTYRKDALDAFPKQAFVVFEKDQGRWPQAPQPEGYPMDFEDACEAKIALACEQVKSVSPQTECYMYTESDWARTQYSLGRTLNDLEFGTGAWDEQKSADNGDDGDARAGLELFCGGEYAGTWNNVTCKACDPVQDFTYWFNAYDFRNEVNIIYSRKLCCAMVYNYFYLLNLRIFDSLASLTCQRLTLPRRRATSGWAGWWGRWDRRALWTAYLWTGTATSGARV